MPENNQNPIQSVPPSKGSGSGDDVAAGEDKAQEEQSRAASATDVQGGDTVNSKTARSSRKSSSSEVRR